MTSDDYWKTEGTRFLNPDGSVPTVEDRVKAAFDAGRAGKPPFGCKCETLHHHLAGDGCDECNKALAIELLTDERDELEARAVRITQLGDLALHCMKAMGCLKEQQKELEGLLK